MKKIFLILLMVLPFLLGQAVVRENPVSIAWNPVAAMGGDAISYEVFIAPIDDKAAAESIGLTDLTEMEISINVEGDWIVGVRTVRTITESEEILYSEINWSDENGINTPDPFFIRNYIAPAAPINLRLN